MSHSDIERFIVDLRDDPGLRAGLAESGTVDALVAYAQGKGYALSPDDAAAWLRQAGATMPRALTETELDSVVGGTPVMIPTEDLPLLQPLRPFGSPPIEEIT